LVIGCGVVSIAGCASPSQGSTPRICDQAARTELLKARLDPWIPSASFTIAPASTAWLQVTTLPTSSEGLFGSIAGVAEVHSIPSGVSPLVVTNSSGDKESRDPATVVQKALTWQELKLTAGAWQLYSASNPGIEVVGCTKVGGY
jgi:hypothetical protein